MRDSVRILIIDDHALVRAVFCDRLSRERGFEVVACAANGAEALAKAERLRPEIALMDIDLAGTESLNIARWMLAGAPRTRVVFVSAHVYDRYVDFAIQTGVQGFVSKDEPISELIAAITAVARGATYYSAQVRDRLMPASSGASPSGLRTRSAALSPRQREVLQQIALGKSKSDIAFHFGVSVKTVETHCEMIMARLCVHDRVELSRLAIREGIIAA